MLNRIKWSFYFYLVKGDITTTGVKENKGTNGFNFPKGDINPIGGKEIHFQFFLNDVYGHLVKIFKIFN